MNSASPTAATRAFNGLGEITSFIWSIADLLRGDYKQADYGKVVLPFTVLRRLDCVLDGTREKVLQRYEALKGGKVKNLEPVLNRITGVPFHNTSRFNFEKLKGDPNHLAANLKAYIRAFSTNAQDIIERFEFDKHGRIEPALPGGIAVCRGGPPPRESAQPRHGVGVRGADPAVR